MILQSTLLKLTSYKKNSVLGPGGQGLREKKDQGQDPRGDGQDQGAEGQDQGVERGQDLGEMLPFALRKKDEERK